MDIIASAGLPLTLLVLALVDGLSIGTLLIPVFLLLAPGRLRAGRILLYLATIAVFYLAVGVLLMLGMVNLIEVAAAVIASTPGQIVLFLLGAGLLAAGIVMGTRASMAKKDAAQPRAPGRLLRWRARVLDESASPVAVMGVAVAAGIVEVASMLPYLVAMTMIASEPIALPAQFGLLAAYCAVMVLPAIVLLVARLVAAGAVAGPLQRFSDWMQRTGTENTAWLLGIAGFFLARSGATEIGLFAFLDSIG